MKWNQNPFDQRRYTINVSLTVLNDQQDRPANEETSLRTSRFIFPIIAPKKNGIFTYFLHNDMDYGIFPRYPEQSQAHKSPYLLRLMTILISSDEFSLMNSAETGIKKKVPCGEKLQETAYLLFTPPISRCC